MSTFNAISQELIDAWLQSNATSTPRDLFSAVIGRLNIKMALSVVTTVADDPYDWRFCRVKDFGFRSHLLNQMRQRFPDAALRDLDRRFIDDAIIAAYSRTLEAKRPAIDLVRTKLLGVRIGYERLILPQKTDGKPGWCISLAEGRFFISPIQEAKTDITDDNIIQLLIEGQSTKEIAEFLNLSPRTIEHRVDRLKNRFEAKNLVHLVAKLVATQIGRREKESS
ncbi:helix-turn-helix transcriptional regulator [Neorhizobium sp. BETTINA12A]|uniref:helix-turn-helix transcriptional regulator n=1 Tax=Neorhizobium sp. BETTINA12A TaxID=2908924 RepID=UPI001FF6A7FE|nr:helix-turn-helix transcriptional regulator [Neorhizobium sp. BETTINA12A]MCJ9751409.1 helix-turn-helix transcriptional regulator [Neorhizobium sp. BETTINA12A]